MRWWLRHARRHDSTWQGPPWESVPCVVGHGHIIRPRVRTSVGPGRPSERRGRVVAGRELAARPAVDPGGGRAAVPCVPVPEVSQTWRSSSTATRPGSLQIPGASVLALTPRSLTNEAKRPCHNCPRQPSRKLIHRVYRGSASPMARRRLSADCGTTIRRTWLGIKQYTQIATCSARQNCAMRSR